MILAIDIGNRRIVFGCVDAEKIRFTGRISTDVNKTEEEYAITINTVLQLNGVEPHSVEGAIISSVVPSLNRVLQKGVRLVTGKNALIVGPGVKTGLNIKIEDPSELGSDMVVGSVAAMERYRLPLILLDMGTATTVSVIDEKRCFRGGIILPGTVVSQQALSSSTSQLPYVSMDPAPKRVIGRSTVECLRIGMVYGTAAMLDGLIERIEEELGCACTIVATGDSARSIVSHCRRDIICDEGLLLRGLWLVYSKNT